MAENEPSTPSENRRNIGTYIWTAVLVLFLLGFAGYVVKSVVDDHNRNKTTQTNREDIAGEFAPDQEQNQNQEVTPPTPDIRGPQENVSGESQVLGSTTKEPTTQFKPYRNETFGFSTMIPADAQLTVTPEKITAVGPNGIYWTVTKYDNTTETLNSVEIQLRSSPSVATLASTDLNGIPALVFTSPNLEAATGYALIINHRLYYLVGNFDRPELWRDWKFF